MVVSFGHLSSFAARLLAPAEAAFRAAMGAASDEALAKFETLALLAKAALSDLCVENVRALSALGRPPRGVDQVCSPTCPFHSAKRSMHLDFVYYKPKAKQR